MNNTTPTITESKEDQGHLTMTKTCSKCQKIVRLLYAWRPTAEKDAVERPLCPMCSVGEFVDHMTAATRT